MVGFFYLKNIFIDNFALNPHNIDKNLDPTFYGLIRYRFFSFPDIIFWKVELFCGRVQII